MQGSASFGLPVDVYARLDQQSDQKQAYSGGKHSAREKNIEKVGEETDTYAVERVE